MNTIVTHLQKYYGIYLLIMAVVFILFWFQNRAVNRYAIGGDWDSGVIILDTRTGQAWMRLSRTLIDLGTIDKPKYDIVKKGIIREHSWENNKLSENKEQTFGQNDKIIDKPLLPSEPNKVTFYEDANK